MFLEVHFQWKFCFDLFHNLLITKLSVCVSSLVATPPAWSMPLTPSQLPSWRSSSTSSSSTSHHPLYMNLTTWWRRVEGTPCRCTTTSSPLLGCRRRGEEEARSSLWASILPPSSVARVTSVNSPS